VGIGAMTTPMVSIIVPTYNCAASLRVAVMSVLAQDFQDFEIRIVGDGCTDDSERVVRALDDPRVHWSNLPNNSGTPSAPRNEAISQARGRYMAYLGHDDLWFPWHLSSLIQAIEGRSEFAYSLAMSCHKDGTLYPITLPQAHCVHHPRMNISPLNWMHTRALSQQLGPWARDLDSGVDREFLARAYRTTTRFVGIDRLTAVKFPSGAWRAYAPGAERPQPALFQRMQHDPIALERRLLTDLACYQAGLPVRQDMTVHHQGLRHHLVWLRRMLLDCYGRDRWPLKGLLSRRGRKLRGLSATLPR
jgi:glycosyltransferase involved in cell wall biosynthesis